MNLFPSPIGELHFSIFVSNLYDISQPIFSVPYRGATFLNEIMMDIVEDYQVSVPYRGATFLNKQLKSTKNFLKVSVPYRGATFLNYNTESL